MAKKCCKDFQESELGECITCYQHVQIMPSFDMCQTCILGEASQPFEVFRIHTPGCKECK